MTRQTKDQVFIEVLQNGEPMCSAHCSLTSRRSYFLDNKPGKEFSIPYYPIAKKIPLFKIRRKRLELIPDMLWEGFVRVKGKYIDLAPNNTGNIVLEKGDCASLVYNDLRIMIKIDRPPLNKQSSKYARFSGVYASGFLSTLFEPTDLPYFAIAFFIASTIFAGLFGGIYSRSAASFKNTIDSIDETYVIPFIAKEHFVWAPEALQQKYSPESITKQIHGYYRSLANIMQGSMQSADSALFPSTLERNRHLDQQYQEKLANFYNQNSSAKPGAISIPAVIGEPVNATRSRVIDHFKLLHSSFEQNLSNRMGATLLFDEDSSYDYENYLSPSGAPARMSKDQLEYLKKMQIGEKLTPEAKMYLFAKAKGDQAFLMRSQLVGQQPVSKESPAPIYLDITSENLSPFDGLSSQDVLGRIKTVSFQPKSKVVYAQRISILPQGSLTTVLRANRQYLRLCYERALTKNPRLRGTMVWSWNVNKVGRVSNIMLDSTTITDPTMASCLKNVITKFVFAKSDQYDLATVSYSFEFAPEGY